MSSFIHFIPTPEEEVEGFFDLTALSAEDVVYDLGSGDGRLLFAALQHGAGKVVGVELIQECVETSRRTAESKGVQDRAAFIQGDIMKADLSSATVIFCYLTTRSLEILRPKLEADLKPGIKVITEQFHVPGWVPARTVKKGWKRFYLYNMPVEVSETYFNADPYQDYREYYVL